MRKTPSRSFWLSYRERWESSRSLVCVGLDSELAKLPSHLQDEKNPIWEFNRQIIDMTAEHACAYKPNLAFYLADGVRGLEALYRTVEYIPQEIPVILDCKVGDIGNTMQGYVNAFFGDLGISAITYNPLMGDDVTKPILSHADNFGFALALTSNPSAKDFLKQDSLAEKIAGWIGQYPIKQIGAVVGATQVSELHEMRSLLKGRLLLIPGIGAQGGDLQAVMKHAIDTQEYPNILINSSRGIIFKDGSKDFAKTAAKEAAILKDEIIACLG